MKSPYLLGLMLAALAFPVVAKPLAVCTEASPEGFDMVQYTAATTSDAVSQTVFDRLVDFRPGTTYIEPRLAERWEISDDGLQYTFHLRHDVTFHTTSWFTPTRTLNADDVLFSFMRQFDTNHPWHKVGRGYPYFRSMGMAELLDKIEKLDDHTVRFTLTRREAPFLRNLAMAFTSIYSAEYAEQLLKVGQPEQLNRLPIGTGPFVFERYSKDAQVRFRANPDYFLGKPAADPLVLAITLDSNVRLQRLRANECQVAVYPKPDDIPAIEKDPNLVLTQTEALALGYLALNTQHPPLNDARVREALALAFDKQAYVTALFGEGRATVAEQPVPPQLLGYDPDLAATPHDPTRARALLDEAGVKPGQRLTVFVRNGGGATNPNPALGAQMLQSDLAKVGVLLTIRVFEWGELLKRAKAGEHDLVFYGWAGDNGDSDNFLTPNLSCEAAANGENVARWCNKAFDGKLLAARGSEDPDERARLYREAIEIFHQERPWIPLAYPRLFTAMRKNVEGYTISPLTNNNFATTQVR